MFFYTFFYNNMGYLFVKKKNNKEKSNIFATLKFYLMKKILLFISALALVLTSCKPQKEMLYFPELAKDGDIAQLIPDSVKNYETPIAPDDMLAITVTALDPNAVAIFNLPCKTSLHRARLPLLQQLRSRPIW